jgi:PhnB protein
MPSVMEVQSLSPYLTVKNASKAIDFYIEAFGAEELYRLVDPGDGRIGHAQINIGPSLVMISDEYPDFGSLSPQSLGGSPVKLVLMVDDIESFFKRAIDAGAMELRPVHDEFHGHRSGVITDPFGHIWHIQMKIEELSEDEVQGRWNEIFKS